MFAAAGAAFLCLELDSPRALAKLSGYGFTTDAYHMTGPHPEGDGSYLESVPVTRYRTAYRTAQRRLGELYAEKGNVPKALEHYRKFVDAWQDADPALQPQVADVKQRISRLLQQERATR